MTTVTTVTDIGPYKKFLHVHEYDDKYDVTGVNMLNASEAEFNLINALPDSSVEFKVLVMNQYLNPAAKLSVGGADYVNVKTYGNLASETNPETLLNSLPIYSRATIGTLIFNADVISPNIVEIFRLGLVFHKGRVDRNFNRVGYFRIHN